MSAKAESEARLLSAGRTRDRERHSRARDQAAILGGTQIARQAPKTSSRQGQGYRRHDNNAKCAGRRTRAAPSPLRTTPVRWQKCRRFSRLSSGLTQSFLAVRRRIRHRPSQADLSRHALELKLSGQSEHHPDAGRSASEGKQMKERRTPGKIGTTRKEYWAVSLKRIRWRRLARMPRSDLSVVIDRSPLARPAEAVVYEAKVKRN